MLSQEKEPHLGIWDLSSPHFRNVKSPRPNFPHAAQARPAKFRGSIYRVNLKFQSEFALRVACDGWRFSLRKHCPANSIMNAAQFRVFFEFVDAGGVVRGSTSTAVTTQ